MWLTKKQLKGLVGAERLKDSPPVPTRMVSNGEYLPIARYKIKLFQAFRAGIRQTPLHKPE